ncbi:MAG: biotin transporter BioY [Limnochordaceae bacterium]|nr:biotin transporter BioY [Limnochordaceae bacterium]
MDRGSPRNVWKNVRDIPLAALLAALTAAGAWVAVPLPFSPVPITLQSLFPLLSGLFLGTRLAVLAMVAYLLLGVVGIPVFAGGAAGWGQLAGPTGGFLLGFVVCAAVASGARHHKSPWAQGAWLVGATLALYTIGVPWLAVQAHLSFGQALVAGMLPFIPGDLLKVVVALALSRAARHVQVGG